MLSTILKSTYVRIIQEGELRAGKKRREIRSTVDYANDIGIAEKSNSPE